MLLRDGWFCIYRLLQEKLEQPVTEPPSPRDINNGDTAENLSNHIEGLRGEVTRLRRQLRSAQIERKTFLYIHDNLNEYFTVKPLLRISIL